MKPALVEVEWMDACLRTVNVPLSKVTEEAKLSRRKTAGYLVHQDDDITVLAITFDPAEGDEEDHADDLYTIPTGWVKAIRHIGGRRAAKKARKK